MLIKPNHLSELQANWRHLGNELVQQLKRPQILVIGGILLILLLLTACSREPIVQVETVPVIPPVNLLILTEEPQDYAGTENADLVMYIGEWSAALEACNKDKILMRKWIEDSERMFSEKGHSEDR